MEWRSSLFINTTHIWIPEIEEGDGGNYTCELQYGSRVVRRTTQLKVTGRKACMAGWSHKNNPTSDLFQNSPHRTLALTERHHRFEENFQESNCVLMFDGI